MTTYRTANGLELLTAWNDCEKQTRTAQAAAARLLPLLEITDGEKPRTRRDFAEGMPYTSSSAFAAIWLCNNSARRRDNSALYLRGIALTVDGQAVGYYIRIENGEEVGDVFEVVD